jgi:hypothetical protein
MGVVSRHQSVFAAKDWLLGTQAAPVCEAGAFVQDRLMTADRSDRRVVGSSAL